MDFSKLSLTVGKTTIMYKLKLNETISTMPTIGFNVETVTPKPGLTFTMWEGSTKFVSFGSIIFQIHKGRLVNSHLNMS